MPASRSRRLPPALVDTITGATAVEPVGARTRAEVGNPVRPDAVAVSAPAGILAHEPADLTVRVGAGTPIDDLDRALAEHGQMVVLDPDRTAATVGGAVACGLSGHRRLRYGPVRDQVLEVRIVGGDGVLRVGGGPTVKNVTGYDVVRLVTGSMGTLGLIWEVVLRCRPAPAVSRWFRAEGEPGDLRARLHAPSALVETDRGLFVLLEGPQDVVGAEAARAGVQAATAPERPHGPHRGRISVPLERTAGLVTALRAVGGGLHWWAEHGIGTVRVAADRPEALDAARRCTHQADGWLLREAGGGPGFDGYGVALPNAVLAARVKAAFDPRGVFAPGRFPW